MSKTYVPIKSFKYHGNKMQIVYCQDIHNNFLTQNLKSPTSIERRTAMYNAVALSLEGIIYQDTLGVIGANTGFNCSDCCYANECNEKSQRCNLYLKLRDFDLTKLDIAKIIFNPEIEKDIELLD